MQTTFTNTPADCEIVSTRLINEPIEKVFEAWINPQLLQQWWGPAGFTNTFNEFDARPGGKWSFVMHGPDKGNYANECVFYQIERPTLIVWDRLSQPIFRVVVSFHSVDAHQTNLVFRMQFNNAAECSKIKTFAPEKNEENFDRLEAVLKQMNW